MITQYYKKGAMITSQPNVLWNNKLYINCKNSYLLQLTGWIKIN